MVQCKLCGKVLRTTQGLRGHKTFVHGIGSSGSTSATQAATKMPLSKLEKRLEQLEYATGLREASTPNKMLSNEKPLTEKLAEVTHQLSTYSKWFQPVKTGAGAISRLEDELSNRAQNTRVNTIENRLTRLEERLGKTEENIIKCIRSNKEADDNQIIMIAEAFDKLMGGISNIVDKLTASINYLQTELIEQKLITDWVKKEYKLRTVQKVN